LIDVTEYLEEKDRGKVMKTFQINNDHDNEEEKDKKVRIIS
jgi:hypothetical protein